MKNVCVCGGEGVERVCVCVCVCVCTCLGVGVNHIRMFEGMCHGSLYKLHLLGQYQSEGRAFAVQR